MKFRLLFLLTLAFCASVVADEPITSGNRIMPPIGVTAPASPAPASPAPTSRASTSRVSTSRVSTSRVSTSRVSTSRVSIAPPAAATGVPTTSAAATSSLSVARPVSSSTVVCPPTAGLSPQPLAGPPSEAELLAVDIGRRALLARYPTVARQPVRTLQLRVRPEGDVLHTYVRLQWTLDKKAPFHYYECEVFATLVYTPDLRRIYDISYKDNRLHPWRVFSRQVDLVSVINEELERRDTLRMAAPLVGNRQNVLMPRSRRWLHHPLQGDHAWHAGAADDHISPRWWRAESAVPVK